METRKRFLANSLNHKNVVTRSMKYRNVFVTLVVLSFLVCIYMQQGSDLGYDKQIFRNTNISTEPKQSQRVEVELEKHHAVAKLRETSYKYENPLITVDLGASIDHRLDPHVGNPNYKASTSKHDPSSPHLQLGNHYHVEISDSSENVLPSGFEKAKYEIDKSKQYGLCAIGAGLSGTVFAERAANLLQQNVLVIDSRPHIGGNCYDFIDQKTGILRNQYGSHLFHTNLKNVWNYVNSNPNAPAWRRWYHAKFGLVNGDYVPIPVNIQTVNRLMDVDIQTEDEMNAWLKTVQIPCPTGGCVNAEQMAKSRVGEKLYKLIFEGYTIKQWGRDPKELDASVTARIPVFSTFDPRYFPDKWQALPGDGYTAWFAAFLDHPLIDVVLDTDFFEHREHLQQKCDKIVYTGPIDSYFASEGMEKLEYRSIIFTEERHYNHPGYINPGGPVLNYPGLETNYTRSVEYKQYLHRHSNHSLVVKEISSSEGEPYYPVPNPRNRELYAKYQELVTELEKGGKIQFVGRLANYKYYNMDQAIDNALKMFYKSIEKPDPVEF